MKNRWISAGLVLAFGLAGSQGWGQVVQRERDVTITGPRGRSIERSIRTERGPGFVDRQVNIQRPGGSVHTENFAARLPRHPAPIRGGYVPTGHHWGGGYGPRPPVILERNVVVNRGIGWGPAVLGGAGLFGLGMLTGSAISSPPPPPVYVAPAAPVYVAPAAPPVVVYNPPQPYVAAAPPPQQTVVVDPVVDAVGRLSSSHDNSRRDGALTLGRLRDPRAVPALVDRLKNDGNKDVRVAAATALGEIGDPRAATPLERATLYDKKQAVRDAAGQALVRLPREVPAGEPVLTAPAASTAVEPTPTTRALPESGTIEEVPPPPVPAFPSSGAGFRDAP